MENSLRVKEGDEVRDSYHTYTVAHVYDADESGYGTLFCVGGFDPIRSTGSGRYTLVHRREDTEPYNNIEVLIPLALMFRVQEEGFDREAFTKKVASAIENCFKNDNLILTDISDIITTQFRDSGGNG